MNQQVASFCEFRNFLGLGCVSDVDDISPIGLEPVGQILRVMDCPVGFDADILRPHERDVKFHPGIMGRLEINDSY